MSQDDTGGHILLVEDDGDVRRLIGDQLVRLGYSVTRVASAGECLRTMRSATQPLDLVLLDRYLPDGDGGEVLDQIRSGAEVPRVPVIVISVDRSAEGVAKLLSAGAVDYLVKPFESKVLGARVAAAIREARQRETLLKTQQVLARIKRELQLIFDAVGEAILLVDRDLVVRRINRAGVTMAGKLSYDQVLGEKCHEILYGRPESCPECPAMAAFRERSKQVSELEREVRGRSVRHRHQAYFLERVNGGADMAVVVVADVSEQHSSEMERLRAEKLEAVMRLAGGLAHEISQPLAAVSGRTELLEMALEGSEKEVDRAELARHIQNLHGNSRRLSEIVRRLQNISDYVTKPYYGDTRILDLERSSDPAGPRAAEEREEYPRGEGAG